MTKLIYQIVFSMKIKRKKIIKLLKQVTLQTHYAIVKLFKYVRFDDNWNKWKVVENRRVKTRIWTGLQIKEPESNGIYEQYNLFTFSEYLMKNLTG